MKKDTQITEVKFYIADAKTGFKKLSKAERRQLVEYCEEYAPNSKNFFFNLL